MSSLSRRWGLLLQQHPCVDRVLVAVLVEGELVLRLVIIDLVVDKEVGGGSLLSTAEAGKIGSIGEILRRLPPEA